MGVVWREAGSWQPSCEANWTLGELGELYGVVWGMGQLFFFQTEITDFEASVWGCKVWFRWSIEISPSRM